MSAAQVAMVMFVIMIGSKILGFVREMAFANVYGTSYIMDAYAMSQSIPLMILGVFLDPIGTAYMPIFSDITEKKGKEEGLLYTSKIICLLVTASLVVVVFSIFFSNFIVSVFAPGFGDNTKLLTGYYLNVTLVCTSLVCLSSIITAFLQYNNKFITSSITGYITDFCILTAIFVSSKLNPEWLICGVFASSTIKLVYLLALAKKSGFRFRVCIGFDKSIRKTIILAIPVFLGSTVGQINAFVDKLLASNLPEGTVSALNYGHTLCAMVPALTTSIISTILYPKINKAASREDWNRYNEITKSSIIVSFIITIPFSLGMMLYSRELIEIIYQHGSFTAASTEKTMNALLFYSIGLVFMGMYSMLVEVAYSLKQTKISNISSVFGIVVNISLDFALVGVWGIKGLALATSMSLLVNCIVITLFLRIKFKELSVAPSLSYVFRILLISVGSVAVSRTIYGGLIMMNCIPIVSLVISGLSAVCLYCVLLKVFRISEIEQLIIMIRNKKHE